MSRHLSICSTIVTHSLYLAIQRVKRLNFLVGRNPIRPIKASVNAQNAAEIAASGSSIRISTPRLELTEEADFKTICSPIAL